MRVTSIQLEIADRTRSETLDHVLDLLERARGSDLILLPELWPCGYYAFERYREESEALDGPTLEALGRKTAEIGATLFAGSLVERDGDCLFNTSVLLDPRGRLVARYRKIHLFGYKSEEGALLERGDEVVVAPTPWGRAGLSICYDLRFPELYRRMIDRGAELLLVTAAWPAARIEHWAVLNRARALENQAFLFSCNATGTQRGVRNGGRSLLVDPLGNVLAEGGDAEALVTCDADPAAVARVRAEYPALRDRILREAEGPCTSRESERRLA
jgi:predicted amidohydrolase